MEPDECSGLRFSERPIQESPDVAVRTRKGEFAYVSDHWRLRGEFAESAPFPLSHRSDRSVIVSLPRFEVPKNLFAVWMQRH
ncbi:hypothetical protein FDG2_0388 [Candidatus Protofrankia californiensis]|uniref:Uncharacterized protein n=1 Tax=Candidatus Protofrankia californiensis TaxID=1839754 RepID=A0A1C3NTF8_9ACTN|nr:hypothetical protein FDG2_0388 [Candidatus Protofrankia californiensis]